MSLFSEMYKRNFVPHLMHWHSDCAEIQNKGEQEFREVRQALISDDQQVERTSSDGMVVELVTLRYMQIVTCPNHPNFSGFESVLVDAKVRIDGSRYIVEETSEGDHGMQKLDLKRTGRAKLASRQVYN